VQSLDAVHLAWIGHRVRRYSATVNPPGVLMN